MKYSLSINAIALAAAAASGLACAGALPGPIVSTQWLADHLDQVQVVEVRDAAKSFTAKPEMETDASGKVSLSEVGGHIPNSRLIEMKNVRTDRVINGLTVKFMLPEQAVFQKTVQDAGVDAGKPLVLVAEGLSTEDLDNVLRTYWQLKVYGEDNMAVLDGGMATWLKEGRAYSTEAPVARHGTWVAVADRSAQYAASSEDVAKAQASQSATLVDSRDAKQFNGLTKRPVVANYGHIEGAKLYPTDLIGNNAGGSMKFYSTNTYRDLMAAQGVDSKAPVITYCNTGHLASGPWFIESEILGNKAARLYPGSMQEWTLEKRPVVGGVALQ